MCKTKFLEEQEAKIKTQEEDSAASDYQTAQQELGKVITTNVTEQRIDGVN